MLSLTAVLRYLRHILISGQWANPGAINQPWHIGGLYLINYISGVGSNFLLLLSRRGVNMYVNLYIMLWGETGVGLYSPVARGLDVKLESIQRFFIVSICFRGADSKSDECHFVTLGEKKLQPN